MASRWNVFYRQEDALKELSMMSSNDDDRMLFAFQKTEEDGRGMIYVLAEPRIVGAVCLGLRTIPGGGGLFPSAPHCY